MSLVLQCPAHSVEHLGKAPTNIFVMCTLFPVVRLNIHVVRNVTCATRGVRAQRFHGNQRCHL